MEEQLALLPGYLTAHLRLTLLALGIGISFSVPMGILVTRARWLEHPVLGVASVIQTIPSLALLAIMVPLLAMLNTQSIGFLPAFLGLTLYSVLPILRNTVTAILGVDPAMVEAARGVGMTPGQRLRKVELPLAMPVIVAGIRTSTVWVVGIATLSTPVGATSLGNYIFTGLQTRNYTAVFVGCVSAAILALLLDGLIRVVQTGLDKRKRSLVIIGLAAVVAMLAYAVSDLVDMSFGSEEPEITVGTKTFTEQYILGEIIEGQIERQTTTNATIMQSLGSTVAYEALRNNEIDVYVDYSGTLWTTVMKKEDVPRSREQVLRKVQDHLRDQHDITVVGTLGFENAYVLAMREDQAKSRGVSTIGDLTPIASRLSVGGDYEFFGRPEWEALRETYDLDFANTRSMDSSLMYQAVAQGEVDLISAFSTDGRIEAYELRVLEDHRHAIPPYDAIILASPRLDTRHPEVLTALEGLVDTISVQQMRQMNMQVDERGRSPEAVAREFLRGLSSQD